MTQQPAGSVSDVVPHSPLGASLLPLAVTGQWWRRLVLWRSAGWVARGWVALTTETVLATGQLPGGDGPRITFRLIWGAASA